MLYHLGLILIGPVLFVQGKSVKRVTPKLPEPDGHRHGEVGQGKGLSLLIVGDSAAAGVGVDHQQQALSGRLVATLSKTNAVKWKLIAQSGDTSRQLLDRLHAMPQEEFDTAVVSIGVNDVTGLNRASKWTENVRLIVQLLTEKFGVRRIYLSSIPPMHLFPALPNPLRWWLGLRAKQFNVLMKSVADREASCTYAPIPYSPELSGIAADGFHPGAEAYRVWGDYVAELIQGGVAE